MRLIFCRAVVAVVVGVCIASASAFAQQSVEPLTNDSVIKLVRAGFKEKTLIAIIHSRPNRFDLKAERLIELKRGGVTENVILAMISQDEMHLGSGDDWDDDAFFKRGTATERSKSSEPQKENGADIFGSGESANGESRSRGQRNSVQGETVTTGTATVRILRPPAEGGAPVKLEKTPTLNNESIIKLVDAGFSEGTIIKRIEDSPSDFDLSAPRLAELRKHRVGEPVITAMTQAMGDDSATRTNAPVKSREN